MSRIIGPAILGVVVACTSTQPVTTFPPATTAPVSVTSAPAPVASPSTSTTAITSTTEATPEETTLPKSPSDLTCWIAEPSSTTREGITFTDVTATAGLISPLTGMHGHAVIWADINGDDLQDLFVGTFADRPPKRYAFRGATGPSPDRLLIQSSGFYQHPDFTDAFSRTSGGAAADLDLDGDLDLVVSRNYREYRDRTSGEAPTQVLRNDDGAFTPLTGTGLPEDIGGRSVAIFDYDLDGLPDIFITEDRWSGGSSVLLANRGDLRFEDVTSEAGIPDDVHGLGVAVADFNNDGFQDIFVAGSNRLFVGSDQGFEEADSGVFQWEIFGDEDDVAGVSVADLNRDGWLDLAVGHHYNSTIDFGSRVPVRIYLNRGPDRAGHPQFEDVTSQTGLPGLSTKAPHVELNDFDNDGWPDLLTSASADNGSMPALFRHEGLQDGVPIFSSPSGLGDAQYWVASPAADYDRDGRLDVFLLEWEPALPSLLMRNNSQSGNWLEVSVGPEHGFGVGWRVEVYARDGLIGARDITVTQGYSAGVSPIAHFGVGEIDEVRVVLTPSGPSHSPIVLDGVAVNQHLRYPAGCGP